MWRWFGLALWTLTLLALLQGWSHSLSASLSLSSSTATTPEGEAPANWFKECCLSGGSPVLHHDASCILRLVDFISSSQSPQQSQKEVLYDALVCLASILSPPSSSVDTPLAQPAAALRLYYQALLFSPENGDALHSAASFFTQIPSPPQPSSSPITPAVHVISPTPYQRFQQNESVQVQLSSIDERWLEEGSSQQALSPSSSSSTCIAHYTCAWIDEHFHLPVCGHGLFSYSSLIPGRHTLHVRSYCLPNFDQSKAVLIKVPFCVGNDDDGRQDENNGENQARVHHRLPPPQSAATTIIKATPISGSCPTFITMVLNGMPFIRHHLEQFLQLTPPASNRNRSSNNREGRPCPNGHYWEWHVIEGVASGRANAQRPYSRSTLPPQFHEKGLSVDGTREYIDALAERHDNVFVHRACSDDQQEEEEDCQWPDKLRMMNSVTHLLTPSSVERLFMEIDADELWSATHLRRVISLFDAASGPHRPWCAYFDCHFHVGPDLVTLNGYGHSYEYEWLRVWRVPAHSLAHWTSHAPPLLLISDVNEGWKALIGDECLSHNDTLREGLVFTHCVYVMEEQVLFKEAFYNYTKAVEGWRLLQQEALLRQKEGGGAAFPLSKYLSWVGEEPRFVSTLVDRPQSSPLARHASVRSCHPSDYPFAAREGLPKDVIANSVAAAVAEQTRPSLHLLLDLVIVQTDGKSPKGIYRVWQSVLPLFLEDLQRQQHAKGEDLHVTILVRGHHRKQSTALFDEALRVLDKSPEILEVPPYIVGNDDEYMLASLCRRLKADVFVSTLYSRPTPSNASSSSCCCSSFCRQVLLLHDLTPEKFGWDRSKGIWSAKAKVLESTNAIVTVSKSTLQAYQAWQNTTSATTSPPSIYLSRNGVALHVFKRADAAVVEAWRKSRGLPTTRPYLMVVGARLGYKNAAQLYMTLVHVGQDKAPHLLLIGDDDPEQNSMEREALSDVRYTHLAAGLSDEELAVAYSGALALVTLARDEGFGLPVAEALACGCPVIASDIPAHVEVITGDTNADAGAAGLVGTILVHPDAKIDLWTAIKLLMLMARKEEKIEEIRHRLVKHAENSWAGWHHLGQVLAEGVGSATSS